MVIHKHVSCHCAQNFIHNSSQLSSCLQGIPYAVADYL